MRSDRRLYGFAARSLIKTPSRIVGLFRSAADHSIARELASSLRWAFEVQIQFSRKSLSFFVVLAVLLARLFLSVRFLPKDTATQHDQIRSHTPSDTAARRKAREPAEPPPDRTIKELVHTWNQGNAEDIARLFMSDGTLIIPPGSQIQSRPEIRKTISEKRSGVLKQTRLSNTIDKVLRPDPETAVVQGTYQARRHQNTGVQHERNRLLQVATSQAPRTMVYCPRRGTKGDSG